MVKFTYLLTEAGSRLVIVTSVLKCSSLGLFVHILYVYIILLVYQWLYDIYSWCVWLHLHWQKKSDLLPVSDTDQNLMHACKHKNSHEIQFFRIRSEPFPNVVLNQIHIRYLDIWATSKHTYPILHRTPNTRAMRLLMKVFNAGVLYARILLRWKLYIGLKLHIQELVFNPCPVNFEIQQLKATLYFSAMRW